MRRWESVEVDHCYFHSRHFQNRNLYFGHFYCRQIPPPIPWYCIRKSLFISRYEVGLINHSKFGVLSNSNLMWWYYDLARKLISLALCISVEKWVKYQQRKNVFENTHCLKYLGKITIIVDWLSRNSVKTSTGFSVRTRIKVSRGFAQKSWHLSQAYASISTHLSQLSISTSVYTITLNVSV